SPLLLFVTWNDMALLTGCAFVLAVVWLTISWVERWPQLFTAFQAALTVAVVYGVTAWLAEQTWVTRNAANLWKPWSLHAYGLALIVLSLGWTLLRRRARSRPTLRIILEPGWPTVDQATMALVIAGQLLLAVVTVAPHVAAELFPLELTVNVVQQA